MNKNYFLFLCLLFLGNSFFAQTFEQVLPPPPAPQLIPNFEGVENSAMAFADVDGDGDQDVLITGGSGDVHSGPMSGGASAILYLNDGSGDYKKVTGTPFKGVQNGSIAFADVDGDGDQDVLITGSTGGMDGGIGHGESIANLYLNDGFGNFQEYVGTFFEGVQYSSIAFADVDGDGDQDVLITGLGNSYNSIAKLYKNDGSGNYSEVTGTPFEGVQNSSVDFADVDGDGNLDVLITGRDDSGNPIAKLYKNDDFGNFSESTNTSFTGVENSAIAFADVDGDDYQDVLITGRDNNNNSIAKLYRNNGSGNFLESTGVSFEGVDNGAIAFADVDGDDYQDVMITGRDNSYNRIAKLYKNDGSGNYSEVTGTPFIGVYAGSIAFADIDGDGDQDVLITGSDNNPAVKLYVNIGAGNYLEAIGTPFAGVQDSAIAFADVNGDGDQDVLITGSYNSSNGIAQLYENDGSGNFTAVTGAPFEGVKVGSIAFADVDNDGYQDVLITGRDNSYNRIAKLYKNDGSGNYSEVTGTPFIGVESGSIAFADIDGDGDQDVLITGKWGASTANVTAKLYKNDGSGNYSEVSGTPFEEVRSSSIAFADIDEDGDQDVLISGRGAYSSIINSKLYKNDGSGNYSEVTGTPFTGVYDGSIAFADIDGDNDQDVLITGLDKDSNRTAKLYINEGGGSYSEAMNASLEGVGYSSVAYANVDGDGHQDILLSGTDRFGERIAKLYVNDGTGNYTEVMDLPFKGVQSGSVGFADIDGDNDQDVFITGRGSDGAISIMYRNTTILTPPPTAVCKDYTAELGQDGTVTITAEDVDGGSTAHSPEFSLSLDKDTFDCSNVGTPVTVTLTITDSAGSSASCTATVTVEDNVAPVAKIQDVTIQLDETGKAVTTAEAVDNGSSDNCEIETLSLNKDAFDRSNIGENKVILTVTDNSGNEAKAEATITVVDNTGPVVQTFSPADQSEEVSLQPSLSMTFDEAVELNTSGTFTLEDAEGVVQTYDLSVQEDREQFVISEDMLSLSLDMENGLPVNTKLSVGISSGFVKDEFGNGIEAIEASSNTWTFTTINKLDQTISFSVIRKKTYGYSSFTLGDEKTDKDLVVTYTAQDPDVVSISGNQATILKAGTTEITATQEGDATHFEATPVTQTLTVNKAAITVAADAKSKVYGEKDPELTYQITTGALVGDDAFTGSLTREVGENVGAYAIEQGSLALSSNYDLTYETADLNITRAEAVITADAVQTFTYDGAVKNVSASLNHSETALTYAPQQGYTDAGTYTITVSAEETSNYKAASQEVSLVINRAEITGVTFKGDTFTYDGTTRSLAVTGLPEGASVAYENNDKVNAGRYNVTATVSQENYKDLVLTADLVINQAEAVITADAVQTFTYDGTAKNVSASLNHSETALTYAPAQGYTDAGTYKITVDAAETDNYQSASKEVSLVIQEADIAGVSFVGKTFTYDGTQHAIGVTGLPEGASVTYDNNHRTNAGTYNVTATVSQENYKDLVLTADLVVNQAEAVITADAVQTFTYDGTAKNVSASLNHSETALTYAPAQAYTDAGTYEITVDAAATDNYKSASKEVSLVIEEAEIAGVSFEGKTFTYDGTTRSLVVTGLPEGASVSYENNGKDNAGTYEVTATVSKENYKDLVLTADITINKAEAVITADATQTFTYDGTVKNVSASLNHSETDLTYAPAKGYTDAGTYKVTVASAATDNYKSASKEVSLVIEEAEIAGVSFEGKTFTYDGTQHGIGVTGLPEGASVAYDNNDQTNAGTYKVTATVSQENYKDLVLTADLVINKAEAVITADATQTFTYDGTAKNVSASLNHSETELSYAPAQGYTDAGTYEITVDAAETDNYKSASKEVSLVIEEAEIAGVSFEGKTFTYDGTQHAIGVTGLPEGASVTYDNNDKVNAGTYNVTATVSQENYKDLVLTADLVINQAEQDINFGVIQEVTMKDADFMLDATASSGLPVSYSYTYSSENPAARVSEAGFVELLEAGQITITARQAGNGNYKAAAAVSRSLSVKGSYASLENVVINGSVYPDPSEEIYYLIDCGNEEEEVKFQLKPINGSEVDDEDLFVIPTPEPGIYRKTITVTSEDGTESRSYNIKVEKTFNFEDVVIQKFNNVLLVNNNPDTNGGYRFVKFEWFKNGSYVGSGQSYSEGPNASDQLGSINDFYVEMTTEEGEVLRTCAAQVQKKSTYEVFLTPNPVAAGGVMNLQTDFPQEELETMEIYIHTLRGELVKQLRSNGKRTSIQLPGRMQAGVYVLSLKTSARSKSLKFIVK